MIRAGHGDFFYGYYALREYGIRPREFAEMSRGEKAFILACAELDLARIKGKC